MHVLVLAIALQVPAGASAADSTHARELLSRSLVQWEQVSAYADRSLSWRMIEQLLVWRLDDRAWTMAARFDTSGIRQRDRQHRHTSYLAVRLFQRNDTLELERRLAGLTQPIRDQVLSSVSHNLSCAPHTMRWLIARVHGPLERARLVERSAGMCSNLHDTVTRKQKLREALDIVRGDTTAMGSHSIVQWLTDLRRLGEPVTATELVNAVSRRQPIRGQAMLEVANLLAGAGDRAAAQPLLDSIMAGLPRDGAAPYVRAAVYDLRGTAADSAAARTLRDSLAANQRALPNAGQQSRLSRYDVDRALYMAVNGNNPERLTTALAGALPGADTVAVLIDAATRLKSRIMLPRSEFRAETGRDSMMHLAGVLYAETWRISEPLALTRRDSVRVAAVALLAAANPDSALRVQRSMQVQRFRERALAETLRMLARTDADRAERLAAPLRDSIARDLLFPELVQRALASGRYSTAAALAERTAGGEARVRALLVLAVAEQSARRSASARARVTALLAELDPAWRCQRFCPSHSGLRAEQPEDDQRLIGEVALLAFRLKLEDQLEDWARTRASPEKRAAAWLALAEALTQYRLGRYPDYRVFG